MDRLDLLSLKQQENETVEVFTQTNSLFYGRFF